MRCYNLYWSALLIVFISNGGYSKLLHTAKQPSPKDSNTVKACDCANELLHDLTAQVKLLNEKFEQLRLAVLSLTSRAKREHELYKSDEQTRFTQSPLTEQEQQNFATPAPAPLPRTCADMLQPAITKSGDRQVYGDLPDSGFTSYDVYCLKDPYNGPAWTVVQRRLDGRTNFTRSPAEYKRGFAELSAEFFIGLDKLHALTTQLHPKRTELWIELYDFEGATRFAKYDNFAIGDETMGYELKDVGTYHGNAGDALSAWRGFKFSHLKGSIDDWDCRKHWWCTKFVGVTRCDCSDLNGQYGEHESNKGINWYTWHGENYSLKSVQIAVRPTPALQSPVHAIIMNPST